MGWGRGQGWNADLANLLDTLQGHICQHVGLNTPQENIVIHLIHHLFLLQQERGQCP